MDNDLHRQLSYYITKIEVKRPPVEPSRIVVEGILNDLVKFVGNIEKEGCKFHVNTDGNYILAGEREFLPRIEDFKLFFSKRGIPPEKSTKVLSVYGNMDSVIPENLISSSMRKSIYNGANMPFERKEAHIFLNKFFLMVLYFLWDIINNDDKSFIELPNGFRLDIKPLKDFVYDFYFANQNIITTRDMATKENLNFFHDKLDRSLPLIICAILLELKHSFKELHSKLRQCKCCGRFFVRERKSKFCEKICNNTFNKQNREKNRKSVNENYRKIKEAQQEEDYEKLCKLLMKKHNCPKEEAEKTAREEIYTKGKTLKELSRTNEL